MAGANGGVFSFGDADFHGSVANIALHKPVVTISPARSGHGYVLAASDGGALAFGGSNFYGSAANLNLNRPVEVVAGTFVGNGYTLSASDGGIFNFGDSTFCGSSRGIRLNQLIIVGNVLLLMSCIESIHPSSQGALVVRALREPARASGEEPNAQS